jgi:hypothetical protein
MITDADAEFHAPDPGDPSWAETNFFGFYSVAGDGAAGDGTAEPLNIGVYTLFRPNLGVVGSTICMNSGDAPQPWRADFCDMRSHLPIPEPRSLASYSLANGLTVTTLAPNDRWRIEYHDGEGTTIDVTYQALMPAFDIHDPDMDPITAAQSKDSGFAWGTAYNGHFDQTGHYRGQVSVRGRSVPIDCTSTMDHSWGPRAERGGPNMSWLHAHFSDDYALHAIFAFDEATGGRDLALMHGYVLRAGTVAGLARGSGITIRDGEFYARAIELDVVDADGGRHHLTGRGLTRFPWQAWPNMVGFNVLAQWESDGLTGYGEVQDFVDLTRLTRGQALPAPRAG